MRRTIAAMALVAALGGPAMVSGCGTAEGSAADPASDGADPVAALRVRASGCRSVDEIGTGFVAAPGLVVTTAHTVRGASTVTVEHPGRAPRQARVVRLDHRSDVAVLAVDEPGPTAELAEVAGAGPATQLLLRDGRLEHHAATVRRVITARVEEPIDGVRYPRRALELADAEIGPGDSGAPVLDVSGRVIGMAFASSRTQEGRAYAVAVDEVAAQVAQGRVDGPDVPTGECR